MRPLFSAWNAVPNFVDGIARPKVHRGKPVYYTREEIIKLLDALRDTCVDVPVAGEVQRANRIRPIGQL